MNYCVILYINSIIKDFLPDDVAILGWIRAHNIQQLLDVDGLQFVIIASHVPLPHEGCDVRVALPVMGWF